MAFCRFIVWVSAFLFVGQVLAVEQAATPIIIPKMTSYDINHEPKNSSSPYPLSRKI